MRQILFCVFFSLVGNGGWARQQPEGQEEQEDERGVIRLNPNDPTLDAWKEPEARARADQYPTHVRGPGLDRDPDLFHAARGSHARGFDRR